MTFKEKLGVAGTAAALFTALWSGVTFGIDYEQNLVKQPQMRQFANGLIRENLEDKIFELNVLGNQRTDIQDALLKRYQQKLDRLDEIDKKTKKGE